MDNSREPATKADIEAVKADIGAVKANIEAVQANIEAAKVELRTEMTVMRDELVEAIRDAETRLLKAFYDFAESNQKRMTANETLTAHVVDRLGSIERRVTDIEKRLNMPPAS